MNNGYKVGDVVRYIDARDGNEKGPKKRVIKAKEEYLGKEYTITHFWEHGAYLKSKDTRSFSAFFWRIEPVDIILENE
ncbi:hypothetical protein [Citrobacter phage CVT22]|uniref:Uncharacterized protein n=1 Tax=Citrobacter phage CVT22 TaxID=1622234 RepID=A0A0R6CPX5_9CAUD|nr:hypothetical protein APL39_gp52 [Citrobacter phage CVT22]AJT60756.2 hypothetical protein [Citrobacter phage CVT22]